jgi:hypothetical protein
MGVAMVAAYSYTSTTQCEKERRMGSAWSDRRQMPAIGNPGRS